MLSNNFMSAYNPFREMEEFEKKAFNNFFGGSTLAEFKTDISDEGDSFLLEADLPGFDKKDISLSINGDVLSISAERHSKFENKDSENKVISMERSYGSYKRQFNISGIDADKITAKYENGVLSLTLPKMQEVLPETKTLTID